MDKLLKLDNLSIKESYSLFSKFSEYSLEKQSSILALLRAKHETTEEILGALQYFNEYSQTINHAFDIVDIVGTGGDGIGTFNISTTASIVVASCGVYVAKHGGRSATSLSGSKDVIQKLGIGIPSTTVECVQYLQKNKYVFLFAPLFNSELKKYGILRKNISFPTIFNILGPLLNPMKPKKWLIGVYRKDLMHKLADILKLQNVKHAMIVHSKDGLDEISISDSTEILEIKDGYIQHYEIKPEYFGLPIANITQLKGGDSTENSIIIQDILSNKINGPKLHIVLLNAGASLYISGKTNSIADGIMMAKKTIENGSALALLNNIRGTSI